MAEPDLVIGVAWYRREEYELLRALSVDADSMDETYDEWLVSVTEAITGMREQGIVACKVEVEVRELVAWCAQRGRLLDGEARSTFAAEKAQTARSQRPANPDKES